MTQTTVATYLIERLKQAGLKHAFGVPGDYVLTFMDRLIEFWDRTRRHLQRAERRICRRRLCAN